MLKKPSFYELCDSLPSLLTLKQAQLLIGSAKPSGKTSYASAQVFIHRHRAELTTPESRVVPPDRKFRKNRMQPYIYKDKLAEAVLSAFGKPVSSIRFDKWIRIEKFIELYNEKFPEHPLTRSSASVFLSRRNIELLYNKWQSRSNKVQYIRRYYLPRLLS